MNDSPSPAVHADALSRRWFHGTKARLAPGELIEVGHASNFGARKRASFVYFSATLDAAVWGAELALGDGPGRVYVVEPTGPFEDDPNLTDKKFPGNPTQSYRSRLPLRVLGELREWPRHPTEKVQAMQRRLEQLRQQGVETIDDRCASVDARRSRTQPPTEAGPQGSRSRTSP